MRKLNALYLIALLRDEQANVLRGSATTPQLTALMLGVSDALDEKVDRQRRLNIFRWLLGEPTMDSTKMLTKAAASLLMEWKTGYGVLPANTTSEMFANLISLADEAVKNGTESPTYQDLISGEALIQMQTHSGIDEGD